MSTPHLMTHRGVDEHGSEEWSCADCGRHVILTWTPEFDQLVLSAGDEHASHSGSTNAQLRMTGGPETRATDDGAVGPSVPDQAWAQWLRDHGLVDGL